MYIYWHSNILSNRISSSLLQYTYSSTIRKFHVCCNVWMTTMVLVLCMTQIYFVHWSCVCGEFLKKLTDRKGRRVQNFTPQIHARIENVRMRIIVRLSVLGDAYPKAQKIILIQLPWYWVERQGQNFILK